jgi:hypothetical protein
MNQWQVAVDMLIRGIEQLHELETKGNEIVQRDDQRGGARTNLNDEAQ